jgi:hypothetical protein
MATPDEAARLLDRLAEELMRRYSDIEKYDRYYRGEHKLRFASEEFADRFSKQYTDFSDNWCAVVADAPTERLEVIGIRPQGADKSERQGDLELWETWLETESDVQSDQAWLDAIIGKRAFALVWADDDGNPLITWEHPSQCIVSYDPGTRKPRAGAKIWADDEIEFGTLYLPDEIWKFERPRLTDDTGRTPAGVYVVGSIGGWKQREVPGEDWPLDNPLGAVNLVEMANRPRLLGEPISDIAGTVAMQDALNLQWSYLMTAADFASFPQRVVLGMEQPMVPVLDDQGQEIGETPMDLKKFSVKRMLWLEDPDAKIDEFSAANLEAYTKVIEVAVSHIAAQTRTPQHYLVGKMANLSADALKAAETGLIKRTQEKTQHFGRGVREVFRLVSLVKGQQDKAKAVARGDVLWRDVESRSEAQLVDALLKLKTIGFPLRFLAERYGLTPPEVDRLMDMVKEEAEMDPVAALGRQQGLEPGAPEEQPPASNDLAA